MATGVINAKGSVTVKGGQKLQAYLNDLASKATAGYVKVGFLEGAKYADGTPVAQVAFWNEFGTTRAPARPFMRNTIAKDSPQWGGEMARILKATKYNGQTTLSLMGERVKDQFSKAVTDWPGDNAPSTVKKKGFNHGLIDSGFMQRSVDKEVVIK